MLLAGRAGAHTVSWAKRKSHIWFCLKIGVVRKGRVLTPHQGLVSQLIPAPLVFPGASPSLGSKDGSASSTYKSRAVLMRRLGRRVHLKRMGTLPAAHLLVCVSQHCDTAGTRAGCSSVTDTRSEPSTHSRHESTALAVPHVCDTELSFWVGHRGWECLKSAV